MGAHQGFERSSFRHPVLGHPANSHKQVHMKNAMLAGLGEGQGWSGSDAILPHLGPPGLATEEKAMRRVASLCWMLSVQRFTKV